MNLAPLHWLIVLPLLLYSFTSFSYTPSSVMSLWSGQMSTEQEDNGDFFYSLTTAEDDTPSYIDIAFSSEVDLTSRFVQFQIRINKYENWGGIELRLSSDDQFKNYYSIPIPFFSDPDFNIIQPDTWANYTLSLGEARVTGKPNKAKIKKIGFYIQGRKINSETFKVDLKNFEIKKSLSKAVISMTFDDGYKEQYKAAEIMNQYGLRGTAYVMTNEINQPAYLTTDQLISLKKDFGWGISSHHKIPITEMSVEEYRKEMFKTEEFLAKLGMESEILHFAYPLGKQSRLKTLAATQELFFTARTAGGGSETLPPADWLMLKTFNVTPDITAKALAQRIDKAIENNEWLILMFHKFTDEPSTTDPLAYTFKEFTKLCQEIAKKNTPVHPVNEVFEAFQ